MGEYRMAEAETGANIKAIDMANAALGFVTAAVDQFQMEKEMAGIPDCVQPISSRSHVPPAAHIKREMDKKFFPTWQCFVGRNFKCSITHETKHYIYFYVGPVAILLFRTADNTPLPIGIPT